jgi:hypothetical protein
MKDLILKSGTYMTSVEKVAGISGTSVQQYILSVLASTTCCDKVLSNATVQNSTIVLKSYTTAEMAALTGVAEGSIAYDTTLNKVYAYNGSAWVALH